MTYRDLYEEGKHALERENIEEAALDARLLLEAVCQTTRNDLLAHGERGVEEGNAAHYREWIAKRGSHVPLQYLTGVQEFMGLAFAVDENVLVPRQDTEILVEEAMKNLHDGYRILDMCTGSGCILLSLLHYSNGCSGVGADISGAALEVAKRNAQALGEKDVRFVQSDLFADIEGMFEMIVSNPPYICSDVIETLTEEVRLHEPRAALDGGKDGLDFYRRMAAECPKHLCGGGMLFLEIGYDQGGAVSALLEEAGFKGVMVVQDYVGLDRVVYGYKPSV